MRSLTRSSHQPPTQPARRTAPLLTPLLTALSAFAALITVTASDTGQATAVTAAATAAPAPGSAVTASDEALVQLAAPLGEPRHYCLDIPGLARPGTLFAGHLEVHSCKTGIPDAHTAQIDQVVSVSAITAAAGSIRYTRLDACLGAQLIPDSTGTPKLWEDANTGVGTCTGAANQRLTLGADGRIRPALDTTKCLTVGKEAFEATDRAPGEPWYRRALTLSTCTRQDAPRQIWTLAEPAPATS
ncbi:hypothetical protein AB0D49_07140 [Streptomyces sp. NPDC048290]|uniref:hypothetical protein n=1 Tax=Streptomyces sp. NPDC048290 TaxID=3155811 RepID=UPI0034491976